MAQNEINAAIQAGIVPPPTAVAGTTYTNVQYTLILPGPGYNDDNNGGSYNGVAYDYAFADGTDSLGLAHELTESSANAAVYGCTYAGGGNPTEVSDLCQCGNGTLGADVEQQDGHWLASYYSRADSACVIPEGWPGIWSYNTSSKAWRELTSDTIRRIATSGPNILYTNTGSDTLFWMTDGVTGWNYVNAYEGAMLAIQGPATSPWILWAPDDGSNIWNMPFGGSWSPYGLGEPAGFASSIISGVDPLATDIAGQPYVYDGGWVKFGGPADQFIGTGYDGDAVFAVNFNHQQIGYALPFNGYWNVAANGPTTQLFGNPTSDLVASTDNYFNLWTYQGGTTFYKQGGQNDSYALLGGGSGGGDHILWALTNSRQQQGYDYNPFVTNGQWTTIASGVLGRLVGSSHANGVDTLYAFGCQNSQTPTCVVY